MRYTTSCNTQSSAPEDGRNHRPKHVELIGFINKPLLLHLVGVYIIYIKVAWSNKYQMGFRHLTERVECNLSKVIRNGQRLPFPYS